MIERSPHPICSLSYVLMFPDPDYCPSRVMQSFIVFTVALDVPGNLGPPV
jgi:hypothetical protein